MIKPFVVIAASVLFLSACSMAPERIVEDYQLANRGYLQQQRQWGFEGRLAIVNEKESVSVSVLWRHFDDNDDLELAGPLGQGRVKIHVTPESVVLDDGDTRKVFYGRADAILSEQLGIEMPVNALRYWVLGVNDPEQEFVEQVDGFYQGGWLVKYREMQQFSSDLLPKKLTIQKDKTRIKLIVDQWDLS